MATRRVRYTKPENPQAPEPPSYANFIADLVSGRVKAIKLVASVDGRGRLLLDYDDPNG